MKRGNKYLASFQIYLLIISIISFSFLANVGFVSGFEDGDTFNFYDNIFTRKNGEWSTPGVDNIYSDNDAKNIIDILKTKVIPSATGIPTASHGLAGKLIEKVFGPGSTASKGEKFVVNGKDITASGFGFSASGIVQGAWWALIAYQMTTMIAPMFGLES